ncbi:MAG: Lrp/AsnC family transcriptional regulator [Candidatus Woesearchaeota archaeon]|jgi:DNA-binding Lrp family transcriptional regulator|nr:hypothetical protein [archaeon]MDP6547532.1 Lrp/AsnC family transcriptional regulator [Candidatus Woesearchaeota archaeon]MDP7262969.1 Lrp/AsnC family transcriptional regulator [Candidatus Woesearchaeota archaeon]MDP7622663.1 Lrp/AsnC family transcriptional regulator [Candidatus Woesearchaeota archaeon]HJN57250.1 Lrp/AsnC family transcriptional regulator [Candidatus Woesearchaeota archaeon]|tara:strand:+ start:1801 stop:2235 length:435 start_codon:yes stop_codon:yes gene_type:complete
MEFRLDKKDLRIVSVLKEDARLPIRDIAKKTGIRPSTVHQRIKALRKQGVIEKFTLKLDNKAIGENFIVIMWIKTKPATILGDNIINNKHVREVFGITGEYDLMLKLKFKNVEEFNDYIIKFRKDRQIQSTLTMIVTANIKEEV